MLKFQFSTFLLIHSSTFLIFIPFHLVYFVLQQKQHTREESYLHRIYLTKILFTPYSPKFFNPFPLVYFTPFCSLKNNPHLHPLLPSCNYNSIPRHHLSRFVENFSLTPSFLKFLPSQTFFQFNSFHIAHFDPFHKAYFYRQIFQKLMKGLYSYYNLAKIFFSLLFQYFFTFYCT